MALCGGFSGWRRIEDKRAHPCHPLVGFELEDGSSLPGYRVIFRLEVLHGSISYQMDGYGDVVDVGGRVDMSVWLYE